MRIRDRIANFLPNSIEKFIEDFIDDVGRRIICTRELSRPYCFVRDLSKLLREYRRQTLKNYPCSKNGDFLGQYINVLLKSGQESSAVNIIKQLTQEERHESISHYVAAARLSDTYSDASEFEKRIIKTFDHLNDYHTSNYFQKIVSGKTIAVVGNGPSEIGKRKGKEIDAHDIVFRINNYTIDGYEIDYGSKTDVWAKANIDFIRKQDTRGLSLVVYEQNYERMPIPNFIFPAMEEEVSVGPVDYLDQNDHIFWTGKHNRYPTTGLVLVEKLRHMPIKSLDVYGFSFLQDSYTSTGHFSHYSKKDAASWRVLNPRWHDIEKEVAYFNRAFPNKSHRLIM